MASPIANPRIPVGVSQQHWPSLNDKEVHPDVIRAIRLLYNAVDDHRQAFTAQAQKGQLVATIDSGAITSADPVIGGKYTTPPTVTAVGGGGTGAEFSVQLDKTGAIKSVKVIKGGTGFTSAPALVINS